MTTINVIYDFFGDTQYIVTTRPISHFFGSETPPHFSFSGEENKVYFLSVNSDSMNGGLTEFDIKTESPYEYCLNQIKLWYMAKSIQADKFPALHLPTFKSDSETYMLMFMYGGKLYDMFL